MVVNVSSIILSAMSIDQYQYIHKGFYTTVQTTIGNEIQKSVDWPSVAVLVVLASLHGHKQTPDVDTPVICPLIGLRVR